MHAPPEQPRMSPLEQPRTPPRSNHARPPEQPCTPPQSNHGPPPGTTTHAPSGNHACPPVDRMTDTCKNITFANFVCGGNKRTCKHIDLLHKRLFYYCISTTLDKTCYFNSRSFSYIINAVIVYEKVLV